MPDRSSFAAARGGDAASSTGARGDVDARLVEQARDGDPRAMTALHAHYAPMVHAILLARLPHNQVADQVQEVFAQVLGKLSSLREASKFGPWVAQVSRNRAVDVYRRSRDTTPLEDEHVSDVGDPHRALEVRKVMGAIRALPVAYREPLVMRLVEGMTGPEISECTGLTPASVRVNLHRGMSKLRELLKEANHDS